ncbi:hypothetical protein PFISCL1PPCAC_27850, partial [Pristionchus fissidentatus]
PQCANSHTGPSCIEMIITYLLLSLLGANAVQAWSIHIQPSGERLQNRVVGENFLVVCGVKDYEGPASNVQVNWIKDNEIIRGGRIMTIEKPLSSQLMIVRAKKEDSGDYMCQVKLDGDIKVEPAKITFIKTPQFVEPRKDQHPEDGTTAEIECKVDAEPGVEIFWQFNGETLGESTSRPYEFKDNKQILVIPRFDAKKDDGIYLCNAAQFSSFETLHINVTAYSRPSITVFETPSANLGYEAQSAQFKCAATGKPKPTYKWFKVATYFDDVDYERPKDDEEIVASDLYAVDDGLLVINALAATHSGQYKCVAVNEIGEDEKIADLKVFLKPEVEKMKNVVKEDGEEVTFTCEFKADGKANAKFVFGEEEYKLGEDEDEEAEDTTFGPGDDGDDEEDEENEGEKEKKVEEEEAVEEGDEDDQGKEGEENTDDGDNEESTTAGDDLDEANDENEDDEVAKELHDATPNDEEDEAETEGGEEEEEKEEETHDIHEARIEHVDAILVPAKEMEDEEEVITTTEASVEKEDEEKDENEVEKTEDKEEAEDNEEDETTTGDAKDEDEDEEKKWKRFVRDITSERVSVKEENGILTLTIRRLSQSDAGDYQCIVENEAGKTVRSASLAITHAPEITEYSKDPIRSFDGEDFALHCSASAVPAPEWTWKRNGHVIEADGTRIVIDDVADSSTLSIKDAVKSDFGAIECVASNNVGEPAAASMTVIRVVAPGTPSLPACQEHVYPNYGQCTLNDEDFESDEGDATPEHIIFYVAPMDVAKDEDFDFKTQARNFTVAYNGAKMRLHGLDTNKAYYVRAQAINEAGESELSPQTTMETTDPWAPEAPSEVDVKCDTSCEVSWVEPNNHGAPISSYKIEVKEIEANADKEIIYSGDDIEYEVPFDVDSFSIPSMKPNVRYEIAVIAANIIGQSSPTAIVVDTPDTVSSSLSLERFFTPKMIAIIAIALFLVVVVIDGLCYLTMRCGVLACCLSRCRSSSHKKSAGTDLESGKAAESGRLLDGPAR